MLRVELTGEDVEVLAAAIESQLSDLSYEIADTDSFDYREALKRRREALSRVLEQLKVPRQRV